jgi:hypothetical protein
MTFHLDSQCEETAELAVRAANATLPEEFRYDSFLTLYDAQFYVRLLFWLTNITLSLVYAFRAINFVQYLRACQKRQPACFQYQNRVETAVTFLLGLVLLPVIYCQPQMRQSDARARNMQSHYWTVIALALVHQAVLNAAKDKRRPSGSMRIAAQIALDHVFIGLAYLALRPEDSWSGSMLVGFAAMLWIVAGAMQAACCQLPTSREGRAAYHTAYALLFTATVLNCCQDFFGIVPLQYMRQDRAYSPNWPLVILIYVLLVTGIVCILIWTCLAKSTTVGTSRTGEGLQLLSTKRKKKRTGGFELNDEGAEDDDDENDEHGL